MGNLTPLLIAVLAALSLPTRTRAAGSHDHQDRDHGLGGTHQPAGAAAAGHAHAHPGVDLAHPIVTESPVPETKLRLNYGFADSGDGRENVAEVEAEYAFTT